MHSLLATVARARGSAFEVPGKHLDVRPSDLEQVKPVLVAPANELPEIELVASRVSPL